MVLKRRHLVGIDVLENRLSLARILYKTLHWVSDKGISEHVGDVVKVLWANIGSAAKVKFRQLICLRTI